MKLAIVVPIHRRPENATPFVHSLAATLPWVDRPIEDEVALFAVTSPGDDPTGMAWIDAGLPENRLWTCGEESFPDKVQFMYDTLLVTDDVPEWYLLLGDDVHFHDGWYEAFLEAAEDPDAGLISSNDMGNPYVLAGTHATHPFISTKYVEEQGASWDGPGHICHTGYRHWWVDEEWSVKAIHDGVFRYAPDCKIEHLHPTWGKGQQDETYLIGRQHGMDDADLYQRRHEHAKSQGWA
jgi:hypothetical protein